MKLRKNSTQKDFRRRVSSRNKYVDELRTADRNGQRDPLKSQTFLYLEKSPRDAAISVARKKEGSLRFFAFYPSSHLGYVCMLLS